MEDAHSKDETAFADSKSTAPVPSTSLCPKRPHRTKELLVLVVLVAAVLVGVLVHSRRSHRSEQQQSCRELQPAGLDWARISSVVSYDSDPFDFSLVPYVPGYLYSYKHWNTSETKGPKILVMLDIWPSSYSLDNRINAYSHKTATTVYSRNDGSKSEFSFEATMGKNASDGNILWAGSNYKEDGNVTIDPNVVNMRFMKNATLQGLP
jgi:hypothetical protein